MSGTRRFAAFALLIPMLLGFAAAASAQTRSETLRWEDDRNDPAELTGYRIHWGTRSRTYPNRVDVGIPPLVSGARQFQVSVDADADVYFAVTAVDASVESFLSNEICRGPDGPCSGPAPPPPPPPPPPPGEPQAQVVGFALWDAGSDTLVDNDFRSGEQISAGALPCAAIQILGNSYLESGGQGSVQKVLNGNDRGCSEPGSTHENSPPYAWETDDGPGRYACAATLTQPGDYQLTVTPFEGDDCSGEAGTPVTLDFSVVSGGSPPPPPPPGEELGRPGQPKLVFPTR